MKFPSVHAFLFVLQGFLQSVLSQFGDYDLDLSQPIKISVRPREQKVRDNDIAMFECETTAIPRSTIYWRRNGLKIDSEGTYATYRTWSGAILRIEPVQLDQDSAYFECVVDENYRPAAVASGLLRVVPLDLIPPGYPKIHAWDGLRMAEEDSHILMPCSAEGNPPPKVRWIRDYMSVEVEDQYRYDLIEEGTLQIVYASDDDDGIYECIAENELGVVYSSPVRLIIED